MDIEHSVSFPGFYAKMFEFRTCLLFNEAQSLILTFTIDVYVLIYFELNFALREKILNLQELR